MADTSMERTDVMNQDQDAIEETIDNEEAFRVVADAGAPGAHELEQALEQEHDGQQTRLHAFAQHIVDASDLQHLQTRDELTMEQTLEEQQHAADLLGLAGSHTGTYEQVYSEGLSGLLEAQDRDRREEQNVDEHGYPLDRAIDGQHQSLDGGLYHDGQGQEMGGVHEEGQEDQEVQEVYQAEEYATTEKPSRKRKRKENMPALDASGKKSAHKEIERKRRQNIAAGVDALSELLPNPHKEKGLILQRAAEYIRELLDRDAIRDQRAHTDYKRKENEDQQQEHWTMEKMRLEQENEGLAKTIESLQDQLSKAQNDLHEERLRNQQPIAEAWPEELPNEGPEV